MSVPMWVADAATVFGGLQEPLNCIQRPVCRCRWCGLPAKEMDCLGDSYSRSHQWLLLELAAVI